MTQPLVVLEEGALNRVPLFLQEKSYGKAVICADRHTDPVAGEALAESLAAAGIGVRTVRIEPDKQGDVIADERSVVQLILEVKACKADVVIAAGAGTLHDITRFAAYATGIPFVSVPTAPSVDGFNSKGSPLILRGDKITVQAIGPEAIFADLNVLANAPASMIAAGFGDMIGKYTSLFDWKFGSIVQGEPYDAEIAGMTAAALRQCAANADAIASCKLDGIRLLMDALLQSGQAMLQLGHSHPASGSEHHLSHYWELEFLRLGKRPVLHGAKVGVACAIVADLYRHAAERLAEMVPERFVGEIRKEIEALPSGSEIRALLKKTGGPTGPEEIGIDAELLERSLREAWRIRPNRYTMLRALNEHSIR